MYPYLEVYAVDKDHESKGLAKVLLRAMFERYATAPVIMTDIREQNHDSSRVCGGRLQTSVER
eukprot:55188-Eustigmatos_ZCMA.PRE.1